MKTSVLVIAHNEERYIGKCIESLLRQTQSAEEIVLIVHNSTDKTFQIASQYTITVIPYSGPAGIAYARIEGLKHVTGDVVLCIDGDAYADKDWVRVMAETLRKGNILVGSWVKYQSSLLRSIPNVINKYCCADASGERAAVMIWGSSFGFWLKDRPLVEKVWKESPELSRQLNLSRNPEDYWLTLFMGRHGRLAVTNDTYVTSYPKEGSLMQSLLRVVENIKNVSVIRSKIEKGEQIALKE